MGIFSGCLLASDYDGTLANSSGEIPPQVRQAISFFTENGGRFTVCTGRTKQGFHAYDASLMNAPVLLANGAMAYDYAADKTVFLTGISDRALPVLRQIDSQFPGLGIELYGADFSSWVVHPKPRNIEHFQWQSIRYTVTDDIPPQVFPAVKIMIHVGNDRCMAFQRFLDTIDLGEIKYIPQSGEFLELIAKETDKGAGLLRLAEQYGIARSRVFAVGDGANDVAMLRAAAVGFVPQNGDDYAKREGDCVVADNDSFAVADVIEKIGEMMK